MAPDLTRGSKRVVTALGLFVLATAGAMPAVAGNTEPRAAASSEVTALSFDIAGGRWNFTGRNVTLKDAVREIVAKAPVDVRIQDANLESVKLGVAFKGADPKEAMSFVLASFNYSEFDDPKTGRRVYLVTSLTQETKPVPVEARTQVAAVAPQPVATVHASSGKAVAKTLDEYRKVEPVRIRSREQSQAEIDAEVKREREEKLARAIDALGSKEAQSTVQQQALADLASSNDSRATAALKDAWSQVQGMPAVAPEVAQSAWRHAAQMQFADADANALLASMSSSTIPAVRNIAQAGTRDMQQYLAAQTKK